MSKVTVTKINHRYVIVDEFGKRITNKSGLIDDGGTTDKGEAQAKARAINTVLDKQKPTTK